MLTTRAVFCTTVLVLMLLGACGRSSTIPATTTPTATTSVPPTATAIAEPSPSVSASPAPMPTPTPTATPVVVPGTPPRPPASASPATPTRVASRPSATSGVSSPALPRPPVFPTQPRNPGQPTAETAHYRFFDPEGVHGATIALLAAEAEAIYAYVAGRTGLQVTGPVPVVIQTQSPSECAARGIAYREGLRIGIFAASSTSPAQLRMILAHETAHILHYPFVGDDLDGNLVEGFANWASLRYWSDWQGIASFDDAARAYLAEGRFVPLDNPPADCTIEGRDIIYNERASFVGYLIEAYGLERFLAASGTAVPFRRTTLPYIADYEGVYGKPLAALLDEWLAALKA